MMFTMNSACEHVARIAAGTAAAGFTGRSVPDLGAYLGAYLGTRLDETAGAAEEAERRNDAGDEDEPRGVELA